MATEADKRAKTRQQRRSINCRLFEIAWEVCNRTGGIYTVLRSKAPEMRQRWGDRYVLVGPYDPAESPAEFEEQPLHGEIGRIVHKLQAEGIEAHFGRWLVTGQPPVILLNPLSVFDKLPEAKYLLWKHHEISTPADDELINRAVAFGYMVERLFQVMLESGAAGEPVIAHFHEWLASAAVAPLRRQKMPISIVFTTHATLLGRYLAAHDPWFHEHVPFVDWLSDARRFNVEPQVRMERAAAHGAHVMTTVSEVTGEECRHLLGRKPDVLLPNGLNIERFAALHEFQNLHRTYKEYIHNFVMAYFFPSYTFDLDKTLYLFSAGRYEYANKGFDLTLEALGRLNAKLRSQRSDKTVVFFLITRRPARSITSEVLRCRALLEEMRRNCLSVQQQFGQRLFEATARGETPDYNTLVDNYWRLRLHRLMHAWRVSHLPPVVTHDLEDQSNDEVLNQVRHLRLINLPEDPVKIIYHPNFVNSSDPLFGMDYDQFVRGCHMGVFPSFYEPWGYTPMECAALGLPSVTSDLSGFGSHVRRTMPDHEEKGITVLRRRGRPISEAAEELAERLAAFAKMDRRQRIDMRNRVEACAETFDWEHLICHYDKAYRLALEAGI